MKMLVERLKTKFNTNEPIFTNEILEMFSEYSRAYVFRLIDKAEKKARLSTLIRAFILFPQKALLVFQQLRLKMLLKKNTLVTKTMCMVCIVA